MPDHCDRENTTATADCEEWRFTCARLEQYRLALRPWEQRFIAGLPSFRALSRKQRRALDDLARRFFGDRH